MNDNAETPDEKKRREDQTKAAIENAALQVKKNKRRNAENNTDEAISKRTGFDPFTGE